LRNRRTGDRTAPDGAGSQFDSCAAAGQTTQSRLRVDPSCFPQARLIKPVAVASVHDELPMDRRPLTLHGLVVVHLPGHPRNGIEAAVGSDDEIDLAAPLDPPRLGLGEQTVRVDYDDLAHQSAGRPFDGNGSARRTTPPGTIISNALSFVMLHAPENRLFANRSAWPCLCSRRRKRPQAKAAGIAPADEAEGS
jgi:hypothetical protein